MKCCVIVSKIAFLVWSALLLAVYLITCYIGFSDNNSDVMEFFGYSMLILCFPVGHLVASCIWFVSYLFERYQIEVFFGQIMIGSPDWIWPIIWLITLTVIWCVFVLAGYLQWFKIVPWIFTKIRRVVRILKERSQA